MYERSDVNLLAGLPRKKNNNKKIRNENKKHNALWTTMTIDVV